jgi:hypothetical protein
LKIPTALRKLINESLSVILKPEDSTQLIGKLAKEHTRKYLSTKEFRATLALEIKI